MSNTIWLFLSEVDQDGGPIVFGRCQRAVGLNYFIQFNKKSPSLASRRLERVLYRPAEAFSAYALSEHLLSDWMGRLWMQHPALFSLPTVLTHQWLTFLAQQTNWKARLTVYWSCYPHIWVQTSQNTAKKPNKKKNSLWKTTTIHLRLDTIHTCSKGEGTAIPFPENTANTTDTDEKYLFPLGKNTFCCRNVSLGPAFYRWPSPSK